MLCIVRAVGEFTASVVVGTEPPSSPTKGLGKPVELANRGAYVGVMTYMYSDNP